MKKTLKQIIAVFIALLLPFQGVGVAPALAQALPLTPSLVTLSPAFAPAVLRGLKVDPQNPFHFNFVLDNGQSKLAGEDLKSEGTKLIKYFLASLTLPENDLWVNLSPYEKDRIITNEFGQTEMGRQLLSEDYLLKKLSASLLHPDAETGKKFWDKVRKITAQKLGTTDAAIDTFNRIWIMPDKAVVYQDQGTALIGETHLKVLLEEDYTAMTKSGVIASPNLAVIANPAGVKQSTLTEIASQKALAMTDTRARNDESTQIFRDEILPIIEKEVNEGENFAPLRQIYHSLILASWYKRTLKQSLLSQVYVDQKKVAGVESDDKEAKQKIYEQYLETFKKGVYNLIREEQDAATGEMIPRKYFSGGVTLLVSSAAIVTRPLSEASNLKTGDGDLFVFDMTAEGLNEASSSATVRLPLDTTVGQVTVNFLNVSNYDPDGKHIFSHEVDYLKAVVAQLINNQFVAGINERNNTVTVEAIARSLTGRVSLVTWGSKRFVIKRSFQPSANKYIDNHWSVLQRLNPHGQRSDIAKPVLYGKGKIGEEDLPFVVSEYLEGEDLAKVIDRRGALTPSEVVVLWMSLTETLQYINEEKEVIVSDFKPDNIIVRQGKGRLFDFDVSFYSSNAELSKREKNKPDMMADIYDLGRAMLFASIGRVPVVAKGSNEEILRNYRLAAPGLTLAERAEIDLEYQFVPTTSDEKKVLAALEKVQNPQLRTIIAKAVGPRETRYKSTNELKEDLLAFKNSLSAASSTVARNVQEKISVSDVEITVNFKVSDVQIPQNKRKGQIFSADVSPLKDIITRFISQELRISLSSSDNAKTISVESLAETEIDRLFLVAWGSKKYVIKVAKSGRNNYLYNEWEILTHLNLTDEPRKDIVKPLLVGQEFWINESDLSRQKTEYIVTNYLEGADLLELIRRQPFALSDVLKLGITLSDAIRYVHSKDVIVRDLKLNNIRILKDGSVALFDFNASVSQDYDWGEDRYQLRWLEVSGWTAEDRRVPLEQRQKPDVMSDIFAIGMTLLRSAVPISYWVDDINQGDASTDQAVVTGVLKDIGEKSPELAAIISKAIGPRETRYKSTNELKEDLLAFKNSLSAASTRVGRPIFKSWPAMQAFFQEKKGLFEHGWWIKFDVDKASEIPAKSLQEDIFSYLNEIIIAKLQAPGVEFFSTILTSRAENKEEGFVYIPTDITQEELQAQLDEIRLDIANNKKQTVSFAAMRGIDLETAPTAPDAEPKPDMSVIRNDQNRVVLNLMSVANVLENVLRLGRGFKLTPKNPSYGNKVGFYPAENTVGQSSASSGVEHLLGPELMAAMTQINGGKKPEIYSATGTVEENNAKIKQWIEDDAANKKLEDEHILMALMTRQAVGGIPREGYRIIFGTRGEIFAKPGFMLTAPQGITLGDLDIVLYFSILPTKKMIHMDKFSLGREISGQGINTVSVLRKKGFAEGVLERLVNGLARDYGGFAVVAVPIGTADGEETRALKLLQKGFGVQRVRPWSEQWSTLLQLGIFSIANGGEVYLGKVPESQPAVAASPGVNENGDLGGIDLTEKNMNLDLRGQAPIFGGQAGTFTMPSDPAQVQSIHIDGLVPVILNVTPLPSLPVFLKLSAAQPAEPAQLSLQK